ncbi:hypothetical protein HII31_08884 [Pseudocercospora fuligena]|uniref:Uncharacterized protein n=1 Tax=Pseudocercospora fuligena TaxID=685502 RepID=A0A8H6VGL4_9PEZI|nr:hypothetical protein HII31_08884 [Pseudocercospora fuligena]
MIYFPPVGGQAAAGAQGQAPGAPAPVGGSAITTLGQTFQPGSAYISCQTLWAGYTDDKGSVVQTGPTFTNAIFPVPSDQVSTQCQSTLTAAESDHNTQAWGAPQQCDFNNIGAAQPTCQQVAPPPNIINQVPEFAPYLFWSMDWRQPQYISQEGSPAPPQGSAWAGPEPGCTPSIVQTTTNIVPTTPVAPTAAPSVAPTGVPASQPPSAETSPAYTGPQAGGSNGTSPTTTGPAPYTGNAAPAFSKAGKSSFAIAALLLSVLVL